MQGLTGVMLVIPDAREGGYGSQGSGEVVQAARGYRHTLSGFCIAWQPSLWLCLFCHRVWGGARFVMLEPRRRLGLHAPLIIEPQALIDPALRLFLRALGAILMHPGAV